MASYSNRELTHVRSRVVTRFKSATALRLREADAMAEEEQYEVSGMKDGTTLSQCIESGVVPVPELMNYNAWLKWRSQAGKRPSKARKDAKSTTMGQESSLW